MPKVSIVLPSYNGEKYIRQSIESVINQTYQDWELIIVNDCSTDNTLAIAREYEDYDSRIKVITNEINKKLPASLNAGFRKATGEYLTWTSDDNSYYPEAIEKMLEFLESNFEYPMVCAQMNMVDENGMFIERHIAYDNTFMYFNDCVGACFLYRNSVVDAVGEYDESKFCIEDYAYWMKIIRKYGKIGWLERPLYDYRVHSQSLTGTKKAYIKEQLLKFRLEHLDWILENLRKRPELIGVMYGDFLHTQYEEEFLMKAQEVFVVFKLLENNKSDIENTIDKKYIIWGAGAWGKKAAKLLYDKVEFFADRNETIVGTTIEGIKVISVEEMKNISLNYKICIAVSVDKMYPMLLELYDCGIKKCCIIQEIIEE